MSNQCFFCDYGRNEEIICDDCTDKYLDEVNKFIAIRKKLNASKENLRKALQGESQ